MTIDPQATVKVEFPEIAGRYRLEDVIASGGVATVVRATDLVLDRAVAVKVLKETTDCDEDRARFLLETRTLARLSHPGLVTMLDAGTDEGRPYIVMELVDGPSMSAVLDSPLALGRAAEIGAQVARALDFAHRQGVVHRDVKPGNVLLRSDGRVKLADFGIARLVGEGSEFTRTGIVVGTVHYLAPEQVAFEEITPAVDVYALGLLLLRALTGRHAFGGSTVETAIARLSAAPPVPDELPPGWRMLLTEMTSRHAEDRPTAAEVAERLTGLAANRVPPRALPPPPPLPPVAAASVRTGRRRRLPALVAIAALVAAALGLASVLFGTPGPVDGPGQAAAAADSEADPGAPIKQTPETTAGIEPVADVVGTTASKPAQHRAAHAGQRSPKPAQHSHHQPKHKKPKHKPGKGHGKGKPGQGKH